MLINGQIASLDEAKALVDAGMDGVMVGRAAYQHPWMLAGVDEVLYGVEHDVTRLGCVHRMTAYLEENYRDDVHAIRAVARHVNGLAQGCPAHADASGAFRSCGHQGQGSGAHSVCMGGGLRRRLMTA